MYKPSVEEYVRDMSIILDHIFSYEFKTQALDKQVIRKQDKVNPNANPYSVTPNLSPEEAEKMKIYTTPIYRERVQKDGKNFVPKSLEECQTWWDIVIHNFYYKLASVRFVVDRQEETLRYETKIQRAWIQIALSDYNNEFEKIYDYFTYQG